MKPIHPWCVIISNATLSDGDSIPCWGQYEGKTEPGVVFFREPNGWVCTMLRELGETCALVVCPDCSAYLQRADGKVVPLMGTWQEVSEPVSAGCSAWTLVNNRYFVVK